jgi:hypothetical protein
MIEEFMAVAAVSLCHVVRVRARQTAGDANNRTSVRIDPIRDAFCFEIRTSVSGEFRSGTGKVDGEGALEGDRQLRQF